MEAINSFVTVLVAIVLYFMLKNAIPSYFTKKGANLADKEDIKEITEKVESVKKEFSDKTEQLRSELQLSNQITFSLKSEERNAIINCYEKYRVWIHRVTYISGVIPTAEGLTELQKQHSEIEMAYNEFLFAESKMIFFTDKEWYSNYVHNLKLNAIGIASDARKALLACMHIADIHLIKAKTSENKAKLITDDSAEIRKLVLDYREKMYDQYSVLVKLEDVWREECLKRVSKLYG